MWKKEWQWGWQRINAQIGGFLPGIINYGHPGVVGKKWFYNGML